MATAGSIMTDTSKPATLIQALDAMARLLGGRKELAEALETREIWINTWLAGRVSPSQNDLEKIKGFAFKHYKITIE